MGGKGSGRLPSVETIIKQQQPIQTPIGDGIFIPNLSGVKKEALKTSSVDITTPKLNEVLNPDASKTFNLGNSKFLTFSSVDRTPVADEGIFNWEAKGAFTGDVCHIHQHTGNAGAGTVLLHLEADDSDITPFRISDGVPNPIFNVDLSGNLTLSGSVEAIGNLTGDNFSSSPTYTFAGNSAGDGNTGARVAAVGYEAGLSNSGSDVVAVGYIAGKNNIGIEVTAIGSYAGTGNTEPFNTFVGYGAGYSNLGTYDTFVGNNAGEDNEGNRVIGIGYEASYNNDGNDVVAVGYQAGKDNVDHNKFILKQANVNATPLIQGDFSTGDLMMSGSFTTTKDLTVSGSAAFHNILFGTDAAPPAASGFPMGSIYVQYTP